MKNNNLKLIVVVMFLLTILITSFVVLNQKINNKFAKQYINLEQRAEQLINEKTIGVQLVSLLKAYTTYDENGLIKLIRLGRDGDGGYSIPDIAASKSDALLGYGVADDISFEEEFSNKYNKESYGFDCSTKEVKINNALTHFVPECIATSGFIYEDSKPNSNSLNITSFNQQLKNLNLVDKKLLIKMDIEGAEYEALPLILEDAKNVNGIVLELHLNSEDEHEFQKAVDLLTLINKNFFLMNVHGNNCGNNCGKKCSNYGFSTVNSRGTIPKLLELTYINKNLVTSAEVSKNQSYPTELDRPNCKNLEDTKFEIIIE